MLRRLPQCSAQAGEALRPFLAAAAVLLSASLASAEVLAFRNETPLPVVVQGSCIIRGTIHRDRPQPINRGEAARIVLPGNKLITIYDAKVPSRILFQETIPGGTEDLYFTILPDPITGKVRVERVKPGRMGPR
jgi:hypothetical protein